MEGGAWAHQAKISGLQRRARDCTKHKTCEQLNQVVVDRLSKWLPRRRHDLEKDKLEQEKFDSDSACPGQKNLAREPEIRPVFMDSAMDIAQVKMEEEKLLALSLDYNKNLDCQHNTMVNEVVMVGDVRLTEDEVSLLNLGPGFMIVKPLDCEEMEVEAVVTMTKGQVGQEEQGNGHDGREGDQELGAGEPNQ